MVFLLLADGFEETEALCTLDLLRRAELNVCAIGINGKKQVTGSHGITVLCDKADNEIFDIDDLQAVVLPGGMPGTLNLDKSDFVSGLLDYATANNILIGAICAAPSVLGRRNLLIDKNACCYPGFEDLLIGAKVNQKPVNVDGNIITARGAGVSINFALAIIEKLVDNNTAQKIKDSIICEI